MQHEKATNNAAAATDTQKPASGRESRAGGQIRERGEGGRRRSGQKREMLCWMLDARRETEREGDRDRRGTRFVVPRNCPQVLERRRERERQQILLSFSKQCRKLRSSETRTTTKPLNVLSSHAQARGDRDAVLHSVHLSVHDRGCIINRVGKIERETAPCHAHWIEIGSESWEWYGKGSSEQSRIRTSK